MLQVWLGAHTILPADAREWNMYNYGEWAKGTKHDVRASSPVHVHIFDLKEYAKVLGRVGVSLSTCLQSKCIGGNTYDLLRHFLRSIPYRLIQSYAIRFLCRMMLCPLRASRSAQQNQRTCFPRLTGMVKRMEHCVR